MPAAWRSSFRCTDPGDRQAPTAALDRNLAISAWSNSCTAIHRRRRAHHWLRKTTPACLMAAATVTFPHRLVRRSHAHGWRNGETHRLGNRDLEGAGGGGGGPHRLPGIIDIVAGIGALDRHCNTMGTASTRTRLAKRSACHCRARRDTALTASAAPIALRDGRRAVGSCTRM